VVQKGCAMVTQHINTHTLHACVSFITDTAGKLCAHLFEAENVRARVQRAPLPV
jgi:hypothetical protein